MFKLNPARPHTLQMHCRGFHRAICYRSVRGSQTQHVLAAGCGLLCFSQGSQALGTSVMQPHCSVWQRSVPWRTTGTLTHTEFCSKSKHRL